MNTYPDNIPECPDCGFIPEVEEDRLVCVIPSCKRCMVGIIREHWNTITAEEIATVKRDFIEANK